MKKELYYDEETDILMLSKRKKIKYSVDCDPYVIDIDFLGGINGVEILNASKTLNLDIATLKSLKEGNMKVAYKQNEAKVFLVLVFGKSEKEISLAVNLDKEHVRTENVQFGMV